MTKTPKNEKWKLIKLNVKFDRTKYAVSDHGRVKSFKEDITDGKILKGTIVNGYPALKLKIREKDIQFYIHKLVAEHFLNHRKKNQTYVIHRDHDKMNNRLSNLRWASKDEMHSHQQKSPHVKSYRSRTRLKGHKLTAAKVRSIKQKIFSPKRQVRLKDIANEFGISEMQLYRIKSGENWGHIDY
ncbi:MAG: hypothetical protein DWQ44_01800 [Bacteroidetes bacterium]|nr:MAG: hypothetical protein DWQ33_05530 [Bacteroidota bacterium]REK04713.1 MAG: hypothetical protein DWQ39_05695 [Bacteroidota bacterium]REK36187.1 MAG: hypothetical protein DWQ44_01800 [Bacteroidota bacterium]REK51442.1 MAG: hypothetical protein DWQ48_01035 [Bacteroidota bacterium]